MSLVGLYSVMNCNSEVTYSSEQDFFKQAVVQMVERLHQSQGWLFSPAHLLLYMFWGVLGEDKRTPVAPDGRADALHGSSIVSCVNGWSIYCAARSAVCGG